MDKWNWYGLFRNKNIGLEDILAHPELKNKWIWHYISYNPRITLDDVLAHPELPFTKNKTYYNPAIPPQDNYVRFRLFNCLDNPSGKLCFTQFEL